MPFFVLGGVYGIAGAQPVEVFYQALVKAMAEAPEPPAPEGPVCGPEGCS